MSSSVLAPEPEIDFSSRLRARICDALPLVIFAGSFLLLWIWCGNRLILGTNDEGIYLDAAERMLHGQKLYVDFFGYMTPGAFWLQEMAFRLFGVTLSAGRVLVVTYVSFECAAIYWIAERFASRAAGFAAALLFFAFETADPSMITAQHRWDSGALALASILLCLSASPTVFRLRLSASGFLIACAAIVTPSVALVAIPSLIWRRSRALWYLLGAASAAAIAAIALWLNGTLLAMFGQLFWLSRNYSAVNVMPYGAIIGGYRALFQGAAVTELPVRACVVACVALPALLPILAVIGVTRLWFRQRSTALLYLMFCVIAFAVSTYPRSDVAHLAYVAALPYALAAIVAKQLLPLQLRAWGTVVFGAWAAVFAWQAHTGGLQVLHTPVGEVRASTEEAPQIARILDRVHPGDSLFVYPYKPLFYFLTQAQNPSRYSYLAPGMMTPQDASIARSELQAHPPQWVLYMDLDRSEFARVFPAAKDLSPHFPALEEWIRANYKDAGSDAVSGYALLQRAK